MLKTIHSTFPSLQNLVISGVAVDIHALVVILEFATEGIGREVLNSIQLCVQMGLPKQTARWRAFSARTFLQRLLQAYPGLQTMRLVYEPNHAIIWYRPREIVLDDDAELVLQAQFWEDKEEGGRKWRGSGSWEAVKKKW
jgi:hypothetical protein